MATTARASSAPTDTDHLIFRWVKLEGQSQSWVASQFGISQSTVSRIIQRYERWQARASEREGGRLDHAERLRYQRWLTFERNELIMASCLRIAEKLEGFVDSSKSTTSYPQRHPQDETKVRTEHFTIDRTGSVCRFLRLAFRINMEQLKLSQLDPTPPPPPLTNEELAAQELLSAEIQADFAAAKRRSAEITRSHAPRGNASPDAPRPADLVTRLPPGDALPRGSSLVESPIDSPHQTPTLKLEPETFNSSPSDHSPTHHSPSSVHTLHNEIPLDSAPTASQPCTSAPKPTPQQESKQSRISRQDEAPAAPAPTNPKFPIGVPTIAGYQKSSASPAEPAARAAGKWRANGKSKRPTSRRPAATPTA